MGMIRIERDLPSPTLISLIGMPASGKSVIGKRLADYLGIEFIDLDIRMAQIYRETRLQPVQDMLSARQFAQLEERVAIQTAEGCLNRAVIATGGSVVYSELAMQALKKNSLVIHLWADFEVIEKRVCKNPNRGIVFAPGETLRDLYNRRMPLYDRWCDLKVATHQHRKEVAWQLAKQFNAEAFV